MKANAGEVYTVYNQYLKRYTACQVAYIAPPDTVSKESWAVILSLDWVGDAPLTAEELPHLRPLYKDFMYWSRDLHLLRVCLLYTSLVDSEMNQQVFILDLSFNPEITDELMVIYFDLKLSLIHIYGGAQRFSHRLCVASGQQRQRTAGVCWYGKEKRKNPHHKFG